MITYRALLDVPADLVGFVSQLLAAERRTRGTRRGVRELTCWKQATFVLVWFRKREDLAVLGAGFGISRATAYRYSDEALDVLATQAPELTDALDRVRAEDGSRVVLDGTVIDADRCSDGSSRKRQAEHGHQGFHLKYSAARLPLSRIRTAIGIAGGAEVALLTDEPCRTLAF